MTTVKERPINLREWEVLAILDGRKTELRRSIKPQPRIDEMGNFCWNGWNYGQDSIGRPHVQKIASPIPGSKTKRVLCPFGRSGDRLWGREVWANLHALDPCTGKPIEIGPGERLIKPPTHWTDDKGRVFWSHDGKVIAYRANSDIEFCDSDGFVGDFADKDDLPRWRSSMHMPRWASRILLEVTGVRVQRLQDISAEDAIAEGIYLLSGGGYKFAQGEQEHDTAVEAYRDLWESINGPGSWERNDWVWAITFKKVES